MLYFPEQNLVFLAVPKAASTSVERHLGRFADRSLPADAFPKHMTAGQFRRRWRARMGKAPLPETFAILRDPVGRLGSWYRYRQRDDVAGTEKSTAGISFDAFIQELNGPDPKPYARIGDQLSFCSGRDGRMLVTWLIDYAQPDRLTEFINDRFGAVGPLPRRNRSTRSDLTLAPETEAALRRKRAEEFALYEKVAGEGLWFTQGNAL